MQFIWGGVNAIQLISHLPLNDINFPANTYDFFNFMAQVVSFDVFPPTENFEFDLSESEPHSQGFELLDYESVNFYDAIGSISLIFIFIVVRIVLQPLFTGIIYLLCGTKICGSLRRVCSLSGPMIVSIWIRFLLETFLELTIASLLGITLEERIFAEQMTQLDEFSLLSAKVTLVVVCLFTFGTMLITHFIGIALKTNRQK